MSLDPAQHEHKQTLSVLHVYLSSCTFYVKYTEKHQVATTIELPIYAFNPVSSFVKVQESLATAAIAKAVQHIYSHNHHHNSNEEHNPSTVKSIFTSLPESFFPILITSLWFLPVNLLAYFILSLPFSLLSSSAFPKINPQLLESFLRIPPGTLLRSFLVPG